MTEQEIKDLFQQFKDKGYDEESQVKALALMYRDGKLRKEDLFDLIDKLGWEIKPEFRDMEEEEFKSKLLEEKPDEPEEGAEGVEEEVEEEAEEGEEAPEAKPEGEEEDDERRKAMELMGLKD